MKLWFRVDAATPRDPTVAEFAARLNVSVVTALGHCVAIWSAMAEHATDGSLARVSDATIEAWAMWTKRKGALAQAFRALFTDDADVVHGWLDRQGKLLTRMERDRQRHRKAEESSTEIPRSFRGNSTSTERNGTEQRTTPPVTPAREAASVESIASATASSGTAARSAAGATDAARFASIVGASLADEFRAHIASRKSDAAARAHITEALAYRDGMRGAPLSDAQVTQAAADFVANAAEPGMAHWRGYLRRAVGPPPSGGARSNGSGASPSPTDRPRNQPAPAKSYEYVPTESEDQIKWQD